METEGGAIQQQQQSSGGEGPRRHHHQTDIIDADANDSGNELSMGGSTSEVFIADSMSHHRGEHSKNHHHQDRLLGQTATSSISDKLIRFVYKRFISTKIAHQEKRREEEAKSVTHDSPA
ncbi:hypothetical protein GCK72_006956 [Caenorhabditis remanei]|uniref:Uncharacterized protein n=1 Tax=Caenorhabditis remanei TaxID=31234 RepID=A0A6A5HGQ9_CAERE|nr:hypothetical protein GCK72_006956 [Caenorhabditis remanei]KAF1766998.1 hypothetical protein GCK72_006956 [Caenorhabditis remanei]